MTLVCLSEILQRVGDDTIKLVEPVEVVVVVSYIASSCSSRSVIASLASQSADVVLHSRDVVVGDDCGCDGDCEEDEHQGEDRELIEAETAFVSFKAAEHSEDSDKHSEEADNDDEDSEHVAPLPRCVFPDV